MKKALAFNALRENEFSLREIKTDFRIVDEFYISTDRGPLLAGEVWKDTEANRETIQKIIYQKKELYRIKNEISSIIHQLMNLKEK